MSTAEELIAEIDSMPFTEGEKSLFRRVVSVSDISSMTRKQRIKYEEDRMFYLDQMAIINSKLEEGIIKGKEEGRAEGILQVAKTMKEGNKPFDEIAHFTGLSIDEISAL